MVNILGSLTEYGCQWMFFDWVDNYRSPDPCIEEEELRMCPLIWCRETFDSKESVICHVFECPRLSNAWYWCPYHRRPERFLECNNICEAGPKVRFRLHLTQKLLSCVGFRGSERRSSVYIRLLRCRSISRLRNRCYRNQSREASPAGKWVSRIQGRAWHGSWQWKITIAWVGRKIVVGWRDDSGGVVIRSISTEMLIGYRLANNEIGNQIW